MINPAKDSRSWHGEKRRQDREHKMHHKGKGGSGAGTRGLRRRGPRVAEQDPRRFATFDDDNEEEDNGWYAAGSLATKTLDELAEESLVKSRSTRVVLDEEQEWARFVNMNDGDDNEDDALFDLDALQKAIASNTLSERLFADESDEELIKEFEAEGKEQTKVETITTAPINTPTPNVVEERIKEEEVKKNEEEEKIEEEEEEKIEDDLIEDELDELLML